MLLPKTSAAVVAFLVVGVGLAAQSPNPRFGRPKPEPAPVALPSSVALSDIHISLLRGGSGGCAGRCVNYRVTIHGDGTVEYEDLAAPPLPARERKVEVAEVVALTNEFIDGRFFEAPARYVGRSFYVLQGEQLLLRRTSASDGPEWDLSLRLGNLEKSVHLYRDYPDHLGRLRDRVDQIGGLKSWSAR
jgi:hypothetical protein